jgi:hypothetical protein
VESQTETLGPRVTKTEVISKDKDGTLEKVYFQKEARTVKNDDGTEYTKLVEPWEIRAKGVQKVKELRGAFKESAPQMFHENWKEWKRIGEETITKPDGSTDVVRADKLQNYRDMPGFCVHGVRPTFSVDVPWEGSMKRRGLTYSKTIYRDGVRTVVEER